MMTRYLRARPGTLRASLRCWIHGHEPRTPGGVHFRTGPGPWLAITFCGRCGRELREGAAR